MAENQAPGKLNVLDKSAADTLLDAISLVGEDCQVIVVIKNKEDAGFAILANCTTKDTYWNLSQARHTVLEYTLVPEPKEEGEDG